MYAIISSKKDGESMKKDIFNRKIKPEFFTYILASMIIVTLVFVVSGCWLLYCAISGDIDDMTKLVTAILGVISLLFGVSTPFLQLFVIRNYPKYPKLRRMSFNSDFYFVGNNDRKLLDKWPKNTILGRKTKIVFDIVTIGPEQNKDLENIKFRTKCKVYMILSILFLVLMIATTIFMLIIGLNIEKYLIIKQNEEVFLAIAIILFVICLVLSFTFAFKVKGMKDKTIEEYIAMQRIRNRTKNGK